MADTATYAGAMKTSYPDTPPRVARKRGDKRPGSLTAGMRKKVARSAAQKRLGEMAMQRKGQHTRTGRGVNTRPGPNANGIRPV